MGNQSLNIANKAVKVLNYMNVNLMEAEAALNGSTSDVNRKILNHIEKNAKSTEPVEFEEPYKTNDGIPSDQQTFLNENLGELGSLVVSTASLASSMLSSRP